MFKIRKEGLNSAAEQVGLAKTPTPAILRSEVVTIFETEDVTTCLIICQYQTHLELLKQHRTHVEKIMLQLLFPPLEGLRQPYLRVLINVR